MVIFRLATLIILLRVRYAHHHGLLECIRPILSVGLGVELLAPADLLQQRHRLLHLLDELEAGGRLQPEQPQLGEGQHAQDLTSSAGEAGLHGVEDGEHLLAQLQLARHGGGLGRCVGQHDEPELGLEGDVVAGVRHPLQQPDQAVQVRGGGGAGGQTAVHPHTQRHHLVNQ